MSLLSSSGLSGYKRTNTSNTTNTTNGVDYHESGQHNDL